MNLKEVQTELALSLTPKEVFENGLDRKVVKALKRLSPKPYPDLIREITRDLDQLRLYLPHLLYDQAQTSAAYVLLHVKQQELPVEKRQDLTGLVQFEARTKANWSIKPDAVGDNELIREIKEKEKTLNCNRKLLQQQLSFNFPPLALRIWSARIEQSKDCLA